MKNLEKTHTQQTIKELITEKGKRKNANNKKSDSSRR